MTKIKHGHSSGGKVSPTYASYRAMNQRCFDKNHIEFKRYGAKGIKVCDRWRGEDGFVRFLSDMGERPVGKTLDRVDSKGDYSPDNCKWSTPKEQSTNTSQNVWYLVGDKKLCQSDAARFLGVGRWIVEGIKKSEAIINGYKIQALTS